MTLGEGFKFAHLVANHAPEPDEIDEIEKAWRTHSHRGPRRVRTARGAKVFNQPIGTIITRDMVERAIRAGKINASQVSNVAPRTNAAPHAKNRVPNAPNAPKVRAPRKAAAPRKPSTPEEHHKAYLAAIGNAQNVSDLGRIYDHLEQNEKKHFKGRPDLADSLFNQIARREASLETPGKAAEIRAFHGLTPKPAKKVARPKKQPGSGLPANNRAAAAAKKAAAPPRRKTVAPKTPTPKSTHMDPKQRKLAENAIDAMTHRSQAQRVNNKLAEERGAKRMGNKTMYSLAARMHGRLNSIDAKDRAKSSQADTKRRQESNYNAMINRANSAHALSRVESLADKDYGGGWLHRRARARIQEKIDAKRQHVAPPSDRKASSYKPPQRSINTRTFQSARKQINRGTTGRASAAKRIEGLPEGRRKGMLQTELKLRNKEADQRKHDAEVRRHNNALAREHQLNFHRNRIKNANDHAALDAVMNDIRGARNVSPSQRMDLASVASKRRKEIGPKVEQAALDAAHADGYKTGEPMSSLLPRDGKGPRMLWFDVGQGFNDSEAIDAAIANFAEKDAHVFVPSGINGHRISAAVDRYNLAHPNERMLVRSFNANTDVNRVQEFIGEARKIDGRPNVVGFRDTNKTAGLKGDPVHRWLIADHSQEAQAVVIHPGYRALKNRKGEETDQNGFIIQADDLPEDMLGGEYDVQPVKGMFTPEQQIRLNNAKAVRGQYADFIRQIENDPDHSPAGKELSRGVPIDQVKNPDGMEQYIRAHPEKYDIRVIGNGVSEAFTVVDRSTGKKFFFKRTENNGSADMFGDGINEYMAAKLGGAAFPGMFPDVNFAERPEHGGNALIRMEHMDEFVPNARKVNYDAMRRNPLGDPLKDPRQPLAIHVFDYLINQKDRHRGNYGWVQTPNGVVLVPLDNGAAFNGYGAYQMQGDARGELPKGWAGAPETISYNDWAKVMLHARNGWLQKGRAMQEEAVYGYRQKGWSRDKATKDAQAIIDQYRSVNIDQIIADLLKRFPNMDKYERQHLEAAAAIWKQRLNMISAEDVIRMMGL